MESSSTFEISPQWLRGAMIGYSRRWAYPYTILLLSFIFALLLHFLKRNKKTKQSDVKSSSAPLPERKPGEWTPVEFKRPAAQPYPNWSIEHTNPLPYRPFRYGPKYNVTMGIRPMSNWDEWIELDNQFPKYHSIRSKRIAERGSKVCRTGPEAFDAAIELLEELCDYLPQRYPSLFKAIPGVGIENLYTGERFDIVSRPLAEDPMAMAARMTQDDFAIMLEKPDGDYYCLAGAILIPGTWRLQDKFGMSLSEIHYSGSVPEYEQKLKKGMENFFGRLRPEAPYTRWNYSLQPDGQLAWNSAMGDEDFGFEGDAPRSARFKEIDERPVEEYHFRSERQSLRRLPRTGAVVFTIRVYLHPITNIVKEPYVPGRLASAIRSWDGEVAEYKKKHRYSGRLLEYLDEQHAAQKARGLDEEKEEEFRAYPY